MVTRLPEGVDTTIRAVTSLEIETTRVHREVVEVIDFAFHFGPPRNKALIFGLASAARAFSMR